MISVEYKIWTGKLEMKLKLKSLQWINGTQFKMQYYIPKYEAWKRLKNCTARKIFTSSFELRRLWKIV